MIVIDYLHGDRNFGNDNHITSSSFITSQSIPGQFDMHRHHQCVHYSKGHQGTPTLFFYFHVIIPNGATTNGVEAFSMQLDVFANLCEQ